MSLSSASFQAFKQNFAAADPLPNPTRYTDQFHNAPVGWYPSLSYRAGKWNAELFCNLFINQVS